MAKGGGSRGGGARPRSGGSGARGGSAKPERGTGQRGGGAKPVRGAGTTAPEAVPAGPGDGILFRLGAVPGATPGTWMDRWRDRYPQSPIELVPIEAAGQRDALLAGKVDAALVRAPIEKGELHVIPLYDEVTVALVAADSHLTAADELTLDDLRGEVLLRPADDVLGIEVPGTTEPAYGQPETTADAVATVAAGVGVMIVPMSLARLHHRKDVTFRPLPGVPASAVALAWVAERTTPEVEAFVGIVRGRTANSSRG